ncbi:MAG: pilin [Candidatus Gracilibacteria bacterium]|nr:pilin [Candidatus Gracilibacteria bacterium]
MKIKRFKQVWSPFLLGVLLMLQIVIFAVPTYAVDPGPGTSTFDNVDLMVPIPTFEDNTQAERTYIPANEGGYLLNYLNLIVVWTSSILGMICVGVFIFSGFQIMANFGNTGVVDQAKERILNAVFGLILLITMALLLHTINPGFFRWEGTGSTGSGTGKTEVRREEVTLSGYGTAFSSMPIACSTAYGQAWNSIAVKEQEIRARNGVKDVRCHSFEYRYIESSTADEKICRVSASILCDITVEI